MEGEWEVILFEPDENSYRLKKHKSLPPSEGVKGRWNNRALQMRVQFYNPASRRGGGKWRRNKKGFVFLLALMATSSLTLID